MHQGSLHEREQTGTGVQIERPGFERRNSVSKGLLSGLIGGLVATFAMTQYQVNAAKLISRIRHESPAQGGESTTVLVADKITQAIAHSSIPAKHRDLAGNVLHYAFGTLMGGLYGVLSELLPATSAGRGLAYGAALWAAADEVALPASGLAGWWPEYPIHVHANALGAHLVYSSTLDGVRRGVHSILDRRAGDEESESAYFRQPRGLPAKYGRVSMRRYSRFGLKGEGQAA